MLQDAQKIKPVLVRRLLAWYRSNRRLLPWRETTDPYRIWVSEVMLQQTRVDTVIPFYHRFIKVFPTVHDLANALPQDVLKSWENMGYYSRARNLHAASRIIVDRWQGRIPSKPEDLRTLPGIGEYSAGAIASIAYGKAVPAVDGNIRRILCRIFAIRKPVDNPGEQKKLAELAALLISTKCPGDFNQALMDLGATVCKARKTDCSLCPLSGLCRAYLQNLQDILPVTVKSRPIPHRLAAAAVIYDEKGRLLFVQRPDSGLLASLWKMPGGFVEDMKKIEENLKQAVKKELDITIGIDRPLASRQHAYTHFRLTLFSFACHLQKGKPRPLGCQKWRWVSASDLNKLPLSKIDRMILKTLDHG